MKEILLIFFTSLYLKKSFLVAQNSQIIQTLLLHNHPKKQLLLPGPVDIGSIDHPTWEEGRAKNTYVHILGAGSESAGPFQRLNERFQPDSKHRMSGVVSQCGEIFHEVILGLSMEELKFWDFLKKRELRCDGASKNVRHFSHHVLAVSLTAKSAKNREKGRNVAAGGTTRALSLCARSHPTTA